VFYQTPGLPAQTSADSSMLLRPDRQFSGG